MIVLIDGLDRCCKDTSVDYLRSLIKTPYITVRHEGKPPKGVDAYIWSVNHYEYYFDKLSQCDWNNETIISNRTHIGESCYGSLYRGYNPDFIWALEEQFLEEATEDVYLIVLVDSAKNIMSRTDGLSIEQDELEYTRSRDKFVTAFGISKIKNKLLIDLDTGNGSKPIPEVLKQIKDFIGV